MPYSIEFSPTARRNLLRLPEKVATACVEFIYGQVAENPQRVGKPLLPPLDAQYSARRGSYRVVYRINEDRYVVLVNRVDHRANVYHS